jgi:fatty aldehyde-generating acyl-ACP reductase
VTRFAFVIHPLSTQHLREKLPWFFRFLPDGAVEKIGEMKQPYVVSDIKGVRSATGATTEGWFVGLPLTPDMMVKTLPIEKVYERIGQCADVAAERGAKLIGLGAFSSVVGDGGVTIAQRSKIGVTTGNSYTVATAIESTLRACGLLGVDLPNATLAVVGATGSIGRTCAKILAREFGRTILVGRDLEKTTAVASEIVGAEAATDVARIREADAIVTVSSAGKELVMPEHLRPGAIVCDVARPRDVSVRVAKERPDVLVIEGGVVRVPGQVDFGLDFGFEEGTAYACMSETMLLALEDDPSLFSFTLGKDVSVEQVDRIALLAKKHGFGLASFRSFERPVTQDAIERAKKARMLAGTVPRGR